MGGRTARTTEAGSFRFSALPPGTDALKVTLAGFTPVVREGIYVAAGFTATVDVTLELETVADTVRVERTAPRLSPRAARMNTIRNG